MDFDACFRLAELRPFELLQTQRDRGRVDDFHLVAMRAYALA